MATTEQGKATFLIGAIFKEWNSLKRTMTLEEIERGKGHYETAKTHELQKFKTLMSLELSLRGLQSEIRASESD